MLRIHNEEQAFRDLLSGNLYENLVIMDIVKGAQQGNQTGNLIFRHSNGNEIAQLIREKGELIPLEIISGATFSSDFVKGLERFRALGVGRAVAGAVHCMESKQEHVFSIHACSISVGNINKIYNSWKKMPKQQKPLSVSR